MRSTSDALCRDGLSFVRSLNDPRGSSSLVLRPTEAERVREDTDAYPLPTAQRRNFPSFSPDFAEWVEWVVTRR